MYTSKCSENKNAKTIFEFAKLTLNNKLSLLKKEAIFVESFSEGNETVNVYSLFNFYVELYMIEDEIIEILPFKRGYTNDKLHRLTSVKYSERLIG